MKTIPQILKTPCMLLSIACGGKITFGNLFKAIATGVGFIMCGFLIFIGLLIIATLRMGTAM